MVTSTEGPRTSQRYVVGVSSLRRRAGVLLVVGVLVAAVAGSAPAGAAAGPRVRPEQILRVALREAKAYGDAHPAGIEFAVGSLKHALRVMQPSVIYPLSTPSTGVEGLGDANSLVALVVVHGVFTSNGPRPRGSKAPKGRVLELVINAQTGIAGPLSLRMKVPTPLSRLGAITRVR